VCNPNYSTIASKSIWTTAATTFSMYLLLSMDYTVPDSCPALLSREDSRLGAGDAETCPRGMTQGIVAGIVAVQQTSWERRWYASNTLALYLRASRQRVRSAVGQCQMRFLTSVSAARSATVISSRGISTVSYFCRFFRIHIEFITLHSLSLQRTQFSHSEDKCHR
jgi:hypothetical protein